MKWLELKIDAAPAGLDPVSALLEDLGITGLVIDDEGDFRDFLEHNRAYWDYVDDALMQEKKGLCRITFYLEDSPDGYNTLSRVRMALSRVKQEHPEYGSLLLTMENMEDADWENNWKQFYKPMEIGDRLIVIPEWESAGVPEGRVALRKRPSAGLLAGGIVWDLAFGSLIAPIFSGFWKFVRAILGFALLPAKKFSEFAKILFASAKKWVTIKWNHRREKRRKRRGEPIGTETQGESDFPVRLAGTEDHRGSAYRILYGGAGSSEVGTHRHSGADRRAAGRGRRSGTSEQRAGGKNWRAGLGEERRGYCKKRAGAG